MYDQCGRALGTEIRFHNRVAVGGHNHLRFARVFLRVQQKTGVDHTARERKHVERPMDEMIPVARDVQAANFAKASGFVFVCAVCEY